MKTIFKVLMLGIMMSAVTAVSIFAQDACGEIEAKQALYKQFTDNLPKKTIEGQTAAVQAGKQYIEKYGSCADDKQIVDYLKTNVPVMEKAIEDEKNRVEKAGLINRFNTAVKNSNTAEILASGKNLLAGGSEFNDLGLDVTITMASAGFDKAIANPPVDSFNAETINYSQQAIQQLEANKPSKTGDYGVNQYSYKTDKFAGRENALGLMNYNIGYILYYRQGKDNPAKKKEALPYFYKSTQYNAFSKNDPFVYQTIGAWYLDEAIRMDADRLAKIKLAENKDTDETLAIYAMEKGYIDRSIDAYARAYKLAAADPKRKQALYDKLKELYAFRYEGKTEGIESFVATVTNNPFPDPTTEPTPVKEAPSTTTTSSTPNAMKSDTTSENTAGMEKPTTKTSMSGNAKPAAPATSAKKPAPKKKGTR